jgi:hypothetical protein
MSAAVLYADGTRACDLHAVARDGIALRAISSDMTSLSREAEVAPLRYVGRAVCLRCRGARTLTAATQDEHGKRLSRCAAAFRSM